MPRLSSMRHALALASAAFLLAACGGGGDRLSRDEFASQGNRICEKFEAKIDELENPRSLPELRAYVDQARPIFEEGVADLRELEPPEDLQDRYDDFLETADAAVARLDELSAAAEDGDQEAVQRIADRAAQEDRESDRIARELGLDDCAEQE